jgi:hypothetical protein
MVWSQHKKLIKNQNHTVSNGKLLSTKTYVLPLHSSDAFKTLLNCQSGLDSIYLLLHSVYINTIGHKNRKNLHLWLLKFNMSSNGPFWRLMTLFRLRVSFKVPSSCKQGKSKDLSQPENRLFSAGGNNPVRLMIQETLLTERAHTEQI